MKDFGRADKELDDMSVDDFDMNDESGSREPDLSLMQRIKVGAVSSVKDIDVKSMIKDDMKSNFPDVIGGEASDALRGAKAGIAKGLDGVKADLRDNTDGIFEFLKGKTTAGSNMDKALKKVQGLLKDEKATSSAKQSEMSKASEDIKNMFGSNQLGLSNLELLKQTALSTASSDKAKVSIASTHLEISKYSAALQERYYKKSIELKYRHLIETKRGNLAQEEKTNLVLEALASISKNTGLPDAVKIRSSEVFKLQSKQRMSQGLYDYLGVKKRFSDIAGKNLKDKVSSMRDSAMGALSGANQIAGGVNMMDGAVDEDMLAMMSPEERAQFSKTGQVAGMAAGGLIGAAKNKLINGAKKKFAQSKTGAKAVNSVNKIMSDPSRYLDDKEANATGFLSKVFGFFGDMARDTDRKGGARLRTTAANLEDIAQFDMRTYNSVNSHIPGLLAKILREVTVISTGNPDVKELKFDNVRGSFSTPGSVKGMLKKELANKHGTSAKSSIDRRIQNMEERAGIKLSAKERAIFAKELLNNDSNLNTDYVDGDVKGGLFSNLDNKTSMKFTSLIKGAGSYQTIGPDGKPVMDVNRSIDTNSDLSAIHENNVDMVKRLENLVKDGYGDALVEEGLMSFDSSTSEYRVIPSAVRALNADVILGAMEDSTEQTIKAPEKVKPAEDSKADINVEAMKDKVSDLFSSASKTDIMSAIDKVSNKMKPTDVKEVKAFVSRNYKKSKDIYSSIEKDLVGAVKDDGKDVEIIASKALDKKHRGKNFYDKMSDSLVSALAKSKKKAGVKFDKDGDGRRDGSWRDIFDAKKLNKQSDTSKHINGLMRGEKKPTGLLGLLFGIVPLLGGVLLKTMKTAFSPILGLLGGLKHLRHLSLLGKLLPGMAKTLMFGFRGVGSAIAFSTRILAGTMRMTAAMAGGFGGKLKGIGNFFKRHKGKLGIAAGLAAMFGATKLYGDDTPKSSGMGVDPLGFDSIINSMMTGDEPTGDNTGLPSEDSFTGGVADGMGIDPVTGLMVGSMVLPGVYGGVRGAVRNSKAAKLKAARAAKQGLKGSKAALVKGATSAEKSIAAATGKLTAGKIAGKAVGKLIPGLNVVAGAMGVYDDIENGDYGKAALHTLTTALNFIPLVGMPLSMVGDYLIENHKEPEVTPEKQATRDAVVEQTRKQYQGRRGHGHSVQKKTDAEKEATRESVRAQTAKQSKGRHGHGGKVTSTIEGIDPAKKSPRASRSEFESKGSMDAGDKILLEKISSHESARGRAGYDIVIRAYKKKLPKPLTTMTLSEVSTLQTDMKNMGTSGAVGKFQFIPMVFKEVRTKMNLSMGTLFSPAVQDKMILYRLNYMRHYDTWKTGGLTDNEFIENLSMEFASLPSVSKNGRSYYAGVGGNKSLTTLDDMHALLAKVREALGMPAPSAEDMQDGAKVERQEDSGSSTLIGGLKMAMEAAMKFFGSTALGKAVGANADGDSSTNKPDPADKTGRRAGGHTGKSGSVSHVSKAEGAAGKMCGINITRLPAIPKAVNVAGNKRFANGKPHNLVIHNTAGSNLNFSRARTQGFAAQFWIDKDGRIYLLGDVDQILWHVGNHHKPGYESIRSNNSLGIEMVCAYHPSKKAWEPYTAAQAESLQKLSACIRGTYDIPPERVYFHEQVAMKTKDEGKEGAIIAKTGSTVQVNDQVSAVAQVDSTSIDEDPSAAPSVSVSGIVTTAVSANADGDSSTNVPIPESAAGLGPTVSSGAKARPLAQTDATTAMTTKFTDTATKYFKGMDESLKELVDINNNILEAISGKKLAKAKADATPPPVKKIAVDKKPAIGLTNDSSPRHGHR